MKRVGVGLIGCDLFGESHLQAYRAVPAAEIPAVFDPDRDRARELAREFGVPRTCASLEELCDLEEIDAVTPEAAHAEPVLTALARDKHVFVEKLLATDPEDAERMIEMVRTRGKILVVGHILRFETKYAMLEQELASGSPGDVVSLHARRNRLRELLPGYGRIHPMMETNNQ